MSDDQFVLKVSRFFSSESWWKPVIGFFSTNCGKFESEENSFDQYECFHSFKVLITDLVDSYLCKTINVRPNNFEAMMINMYEIENPQISIIIDHFRSLNDFIEFKQEMVQYNGRIQEEATLAMEEFRSLPQDEEMGDTSLAMNVAEFLEKSEAKSLEQQTIKMCMKMKEDLHFDQIPNSNVRVPSPLKSNSSPISSPLKSLTPISSPQSHDFEKKPMPFPMGMDSMRKSSNSGIPKPTIMKPTNVKNAKRTILGPITK